MEGGGAQKSEYPFLNRIGQIELLDSTASILRSTPRRNNPRILDHQNHQPLGARMRCPTPLPRIRLRRPARPFPFQARHENCGNLLRVAAVKVAKYSIFYRVPVFWRSSCSLF